MALFNRTNKNAADALSPLSDSHRKRQELFAAYWRYYRGHHKRHLKIKTGKPDDNVTLNYSKRVVNKGVQFLFGKPINFEIDEANERNEQELYLDTVWGTDEEKQQLLQKVALNGGITGHAFVRLHPAEDMQNELPRLINLDPMALDVLTNPDDVEDVREYRIIWQSGDTWRRQRIMADNERGEWLIVDEVADKGGRWVLLNDDAEQPWEYPFPPLFHCQNMPNPNEFWGISDLIDADLNDAINFVASNTNRIIRFHGHPRTIGTGFNAQALASTAVDDFWSIDSKDANVFNLEMQSDLQSAREYLAMLKNAYSKITGVPELDPSQVNVGALSGFALKILYGDLLELTRVKRNTYGAMLSELNRALLILRFGDNTGNVDVSNKWGDPLPSSDMEEAQVLEIDRRNGVSEETYLERRGYNVEREQERRSQEQTQQSNIGSALLAAFERGGQVQ